MTVIVISHSSTFTSYLIAFSIFLYYHSKSRFLKIFVVELNTNNLNKTNHDVKPWCGVSTLNNLRFDSHENFFNHLISQILLLPEIGALALHLVSISTDELRKPVNMDIPIRSQNNVIHASITDNFLNAVGLIYHPIVLMNRLRFLMARTNKVVFMTLARNLSLDDLLHNIQRIEKHENVISLDFTIEQTGPMNKFDYFIHSNLVGVRYKNPGIILNLKPPNFIVWLPMFRGSLGLSGYGSYRHQVSFQDRIINIKLSPVVDNALENQVIPELDLFHGLKISDYTLRIIENIISVGKISLITNRL